MADIRIVSSENSQPAGEEDLLSLLQREVHDAVRRIANQLHLPDQPRSGPEASSKYRLVCQAYEARRERTQFFDADLFGEPVWDLLLAMYREHLRGGKLSVQQVADAADVPSSTARRWIEVLERRNLISLAPQAEAAFVELTTAALTKLEAYMEQLRTKSLMRLI